jgi:ABC-type multidrug transport system fused ATPase/permease subunit
MRPGWRRLGTHLAAHKRAVVAVIAWSMMEALPVLLSGQLVSLAVDRGFAAGRLGEGLGWLAAFGLAMLVGAAGSRQVVSQVGVLVEPLRDALVWQVVTGSLNRSATVTAGPPDHAAVARLCRQVEIVRDVLAGLLISATQFVLAGGAVLAGISTLSPDVLPLVAAPLAAAVALFLGTLRPMVARQREQLLAEERLTAGAGDVLSALTDIVGCGAEAAATDGVVALIADQARVARILAAYGSLRKLTVALGAYVPMALVVLAAAGPYRHQFNAGSLVGVLVYVGVNLEPALRTMVEGGGNSFQRLAVAIDRIAEASQPDVTLMADAYGGGDVSGESDTAHRADASAGVNAAARPDAAGRVGNVAEPNAARDTDTDDTDTTDPKHRADTEATADTTCAVDVAALNPRSEVDAASKAGAANRADNAAEPDTAHYADPTAPAHKAGIASRPDTTGRGVSGERWNRRLAVRRATGTEEARGPGRRQAPAARPVTVDRCEDRGTPNDPPSRGRGASRTRAVPPGRRQPDSPTGRVDAPAKVDASFKADAVSRGDAVDGVGAVDRVDAVDRVGSATGPGAAGGVDVVDGAGVVSLGGDELACAGGLRLSRPVHGLGDGRREPGRPAAVELRDVTFRYGPGAVPTVRAVSMAVPAGAHLAIVGPSGAGKSTLANLLAGLLRPQSGQILIDGRPLGELSGHELSRARVLIPQQAYVFEGTLRENLCYLNRDADEAALRAAVDALGLSAVVEGAGGIDGLISPDRLSAGERQLVALTRAYLAPAGLAVLDEATCYMDPLTESRAEQAFRARPGTLIVIAHRISSALRADLVLLMDGSADAAAPRPAPHATLLADSPLYASLVDDWAATPSADVSSGQRASP